MKATLPRRLRQTETLRPNQTLWRYGRLPFSAGVVVDVLVEVWRLELNVNQLTVLGFSFSCVYFNIFTVVGRCFRRKLGLANGLSVAGVSVGQMAFPGLVTHLLQLYGVRAGTLIMSAFSLNLCVTAALMPRHVIDSEVDRDVIISSSSMTKESSSSPLGGSADDLEAREGDPMLEPRPS